MKPIVIYVGEEHFMTITHPAVFVSWLNTAAAQCFDPETRRELAQLATLIDAEADEPKQEA